MQELDVHDIDGKTLGELVQTGFLASLLGNNKDANIIFQGISALRPENIDVLLGLAVTYIYNGDYQAAIKLLETRVLAQRPDDQLARCFLGWAYDMAGQRSTSDGLFDQVRHNGNVTDIALAESLLTQRDQPNHQ